MLANALQAIGVRARVATAPPSADRLRQDLHVSRGVQRVHQVGRRHACSRFADAVAVASVGGLRKDFFFSRRFFSNERKSSLVIERAVLRLELHDCEVGDHLEVANVGRGYAIAEFKCRHTDQQIRQWQPHPSRLILAVNFSGTNRYHRCYKIDR
jgi:hypothetical protein